MDDLLDVCLRRGHHAKPPDTTILTYGMEVLVCMYVCMSGSVSHGEERGGNHIGKIRYLVFFILLHICMGMGFEDC